MMTISTPHPLRTIKLAYHTDKTPSTWETEALAAYFHMHDEVWQLKTQREANVLALTEAIGIMDELQIRLFPIEQEIEILEVAFGIQKVDTLPDFVGSLDIDLKAFNNTIIRHHTDLDALHAQVTACVNAYNDFLKEYERFDEWFEDYAHGTLHKLYQEWESLSVDTVSLDQDHQAFLDVLSPISAAENQYFEQADACFESYKALVKTANALYRRTEVIDDFLNSKGYK